MHGLSIFQIYSADQIWEAPWFIGFAVVLDHRCKDIQSHYKPVFLVIAVLIVVNKRIFLSIYYHICLLVFFLSSFLSLWDFFFLSNHLCYELWYYDKLARQTTNEQTNRGFSCDVISSQFCKSSYSESPCWFPFAWPGIGIHNKMHRYFSFSSYHSIKLRPSDKNFKTHTRLKFQIFP